MSDDPTERELNETLQWMVKEGLCEVGINDDDEFVFWMTDETKEKIERTFPLTNPTNPLEAFADDDTTDMDGEVEEEYPFDLYDD
jgi:hypothetical protein